MPTPPSDVASGSVATSSWANSVSDALQEIIATIYSGASLAIPYASVTGKPSTFAPTVHSHADAAGGGTITYANISAKPATFAPEAHETSHKTGGSDSFTASEIGGFDRSASSGTVGTKIHVGTATPATASEGDIWIKG
jgi:hypothetical protein